MKNYTMEFKKDYVAKMAELRTSGLSIEKAQKKLGGTISQGSYWAWSHNKALIGGGITPAIESTPIAKTVVVKTVRKYNKKSPALVSTLPILPAANFSKCAVVFGDSSTVFQALSEYFRD